MGQKVKGYRRNAVYGQEKRRRGERGGWIGEVNPPGKDGWEKSGVGRSEKEYGRGEGRGTERRERVEEVRKSEGYESNGRGRKGDGKKGYVVYGEYVKVVDRKVKKVAARRELRRAKVMEERNRRKTTSIVRSRSKVGRVPVEKVVSVRIRSTRIGRGSSKRSDRRTSPQTKLVKVRKLGRIGLEAKRERRVRRYETEVGRKVTRERVNRCEVREGRGRKRERGKRRRGRVARERRYREKSAGKAAAKQEAVYAQRTKEVKKLRSTQKTQPELARPAQTIESGKSSEEAARKDVRERLDAEILKRRKVKGKVAFGYGTVMTEAMAVVVVRGGVRRVERRRLKRRIRKREGAGRRHRRVRREWSRRRKAHGRKSKYGLRMPEVMDGVQKVESRKGRAAIAPQGQGSFTSTTAGVLKVSAEAPFAEGYSLVASGTPANEALGLHSRKLIPRQSKQGLFGEASLALGMERKKRTKPTKRTQRDVRKGGSFARVRRKPLLAKVLKKQLGGYYGYRVRVKGPLNGSRRTTRREMGLGTVPGSTKRGRIGTAEGVAKTSVGTRGVQVGYCYGR